MAFSTLCNLAYRQNVFRMSCLHNHPPTTLLFLVPGWEGAKEIKRPPGPLPSSTWGTHLACLSTPSLPAPQRCGNFTLKYNSGTWPGPSTPLSLDKKAPLATCAEGFRCHKRANFCTSDGPECLWRVDILMWRHLRFSSAPTKAKVPSVPCLHVGSCEIIFGLNIWSRTRLGRRETTWSRKTICHLADNQCNNTAHVNPHLFIFFVLRNASESR